MTGREWMDKFMKMGAAKAFSEELNDDDRLFVLEQLGKPCSRCGGFGRWCCYDPPYDID